MFSRTDRSVLGVWWWTVDRWLLGAAGMLAIMGVFLVMAASPPVADRIGYDSQHFVYRHGIFLIPALLMLFISSALSHRMIRIMGLLGLLGSIFLIAMAIFIGPEIKGATRWIPLGPFKLQPSEFAKPFFAVVTAWLLSLWREEKNFPGWIISMFGLALLAGLLVLQPDMGMTFVVLFTWSLQIFLAGMPIAIVLLLGVLIAPIFAVSAFFLLPHVKARVMKFWDGGSMQADNAMRSFSNGGLTGVGPGNGEVKYHLPDAHADFIFAVAGEEFGAILPCTTPTGARVAAERLRAAIEIVPFDIGKQHIDCTVSIGGVSIGLNSDVSGADDVVELADNALYEAKNNGRNQVRWAKPATKST